MIMIILRIKICLKGATAWLEAKVTDNGAVEDNDDWKVSFDKDDGDWRNNTTDWSQISKRMQMYQS